MMMDDDCRSGRMAQFKRYCGIDYSGADTPTACLKGLRVFLADGNAVPVEILPVAGSCKFWSRRSLAEWLVGLLRENVPTLVGIDHGFSFPLRYFEAHEVKPDWSDFLNDFCKHWPTDGDATTVEHVRHGLVGQGRLRGGNARWRRLTEERCRAKSVFHFDVPGSVAKSTHAGLPWLRYMRGMLGERLWCWPFDGWDVPADVSVLAEAYPSLWKGKFAVDGLSSDQQDAYTVAAWLQQADRSGELLEHLRPVPGLLQGDLTIIEGWIIGVS